MPCRAMPCWAAAGSGLGGLGVVSPFPLSDAAKPLRFGLRSARRPATKGRDPRPRPGCALP